jgi:hypothetical protein
MKKIFMVLVCLCSIEVSAGTCDPKLLEMKAFAAAVGVERADVFGEQPDMAIEPMNSHDAYRIVFTYSGIRSVWVVRVDDILCRVHSVTRM